MQKKSIYKYASEAGVPFGLYLTLMSACLLLSLKIPSLPILIVPLAIGLPFILWILLRRICKEEPSYMKFASVWLAGIYTVIFGCLICFFLSALYIVFIEPSFVIKYILAAIEAVESTPMAAEYETTTYLMREAIEAHILPSGLEFLTSMAWFTCFTGSILSLFIALLMVKNTSKISRQASF